MRSHLAKMKLQSSTEFELGCLVEAFMGPISEGKEPGSCSGILLGEGLVLTHASVLLTSLSAAELSSLHASETLPSHVLSDINVQVTIERVNSSNEVDISPRKTIRSHLEIARVKSELPKQYSALVDASSRRQAEENMCQVNGRILHIWKSAKFAKTLQNVLPSSEGWSFVEASESKEGREDMQDKVNLLIPYFLLLKLDNVSTKTDALVHHGKLHKGQKVWCMGSPFGNLCPPVFLNCVSQGIVGNLAGPSDEVILTDARCIPGTEGGAIYISSLRGREIVGVVVAPLCWKTNEWVGLTIACSLPEVLSSLGHSLSSASSIATSIPVIMKSNISAKDDMMGDLDLLRSSEDSDLQLNHFPSVCLIECEGSWGSGVLIDRKGIVLTCSHVVKFRKSSQVSVIFPERSAKVQLKAEVVGCATSKEVFDIAILRIKNFKQNKNLYKPVRVASPRSGMQVVTQGHGCFAADKELSPTLTQGHISKVVKVGNSPVIVQSSCAVHAGASGGALLTPDGSLVGILTCNSRDTETGASYPHVNMSVPVITLWPYIQAYLETEDERYLKFLSVQNSQASDLWGLRASLGATKSKL